MTDYFRYMHIPPDLGDRFIDVFTRMEYALKASGIYANGGDKHVSPAWSRFARDIDSALRAIKDNDLHAALDYLRSNPVRVQTKAGFAPLILDPNQTDTQRTFDVICMVRNNILHGGKIQIQGESEEGRNEKLVSASLIILDHASGLIDTVRAKFQETAAKK